MGNFQGHQEGLTDDAPSSVPPLKTPRKESDIASATQRIRNAAALVRAQQKVARERLNPVQRPKVDMMLSRTRVDVVRSILILFFLTASTSARAQYGYAPPTPSYPPNGGSFASPVTRPVASSMPQAMLEAHNVIRGRVGVPPLVWSDQLARWRRTGLII